MPYDIGNAQDSGYELVISNFKYLEDKFYKVLYADTFWRGLFPSGSVKGNINPGATSMSYPVRDWTGRGSFRASQSGDIPVVGTSISAPATVPINTGVCGYNLDLDEMRTYGFAYGGNLQTEAPEVMGMACDKHVEAVVFYGDESLGYQPWMNFPGVTVTQGFLPDAGVDPDDRAFAKKNGDQIAKDINDGISKVWLDSKMIHLPGNVWLPPAQFGLLSTTRMPDIDKTVLEYIKLNNIFTSNTGRPLEIKPIPHLQGAGVFNVTAMDRMVIEENIERNHILPFPIAFRMLPPFKDVYGVKLIAEYRFGSYHNRYPGSMIYVDEI